MRKHYSHNRNTYTTARTKQSADEGVTIRDSLAYKFYDGEFHGIPFLFAEPKGKVADGSKRKVIHFDKTGKDLWEQAQSVHINPVE